MLPKWDRRTHLSNHGHQRIGKQGCIAGSVGSPRLPQGQRVEADPRVGPGS